VSKRILIIDGHPDALAERYLHALSKAYCDGAHAGGHEVRSIIVSELDFSLLRTSHDFQEGVPTESIGKCQELVSWAEHVVILFPLWLGGMPALLKGFLEQVLRPAFAFRADSHGWPKKLLKGRSARVIITMGMPAALYRWYFGAHGLKSLRRNILHFCGFSPIRESLIGAVEDIGAKGRGIWLAKIQKLGRHAR